MVTPSPLHPLAATDFYQVLETSDVPAGVVNIVAGERDVLAKTLADHDEVAAHWYVGSAEGSAMVEKASAGNVKATWVNYGHGRDWFAAAEGQGETYLHHATQIKNIWGPVRGVICVSPLRPLGGRGAASRANRVRWVAPHAHLILPTSCGEGFVLPRRCIAPASFVTLTQNYHGLPALGRRPAMSLP